jgi:hypothetical protein
MTPDISFIISTILKIFILLGLAVYSIFAVVMVRQEYLMAHVLEEAFEPMLRLLVYIHLLASLGILILAFFIL